MLLHNALTHPQAQAGTLGMLRTGTAEDQDRHLPFNVLVRDATELADLDPFGEQIGRADRPRIRQHLRARCALRRINPMVPLPGRKMSAT